MYVNNDLQLQLRAHRSTTESNVFIMYYVGICQRMYIFMKLGMGVLDDDLIRFHVIEPLHTPRSPLFFGGRETFLPVGLRTHMDALSIYYKFVLDTLSWRIGTGHTLPIACV